MKTEIFPSANLDSQLVDEVCVNDIHDFSDEELVVVFQKTISHEAYSELLSRYDDKIKLFIRNNVQNIEEQKDVYQTICMRIYTQLLKGLYCNQNKFSGWIMTVTHNTTLQIYRNCHRYSIVYSSTYEPYYTLIDNSRETNIEAGMSKKLSVWLNHIPEEQRIVLEMYYFKNMKFNQIAKVLDVPINTVIGRSRYGRLNLRKIAQKENCTISQFFDF